ncbi:replication initiation protein [Lactococcus hodotermopsidis]|uniref:Replication initiation protein n=1 Tax=Pseudolactococcus hodotermopsidis TaxID=2709157 RepID=A0A6A0BCY7_9LACT|nr:replication initiation protein [Lactococcus hodotermopsidis]GFH43279.1 replication initiation protein [Lactococcus hodotermopsidis]
MKEVTRYKNEMNTLSIGKWTAEEMNFLFAILTQVRDEGTKELKFDTYTLREYVNFDPKKPERWNKAMVTVANKVGQLVYRNIEDNVFRVLPLFQELAVDMTEHTVTVQVSEKMEYILNRLNIDTKEWTQFDFLEFATLKSVYSKSVYRFLKQFRRTGFWKVTIEDFRLLLAIPKSYSPSDIDKRVLKPVMNELPAIFKGLKVHKIKSRRRGNQLLGFEFTFQQKQTGTYIENKYDNQNKKQTPEWSDPNYKNQTTEEEIKNLEQIKKQAIKKMNFENEEQTSFDI